MSPFSPVPRSQVKVVVGDRVRAGSEVGTVTLIAWSLSSETWLITVENDRCRRMTYREDQVLLLERP